jgi:hypothetical protein
VFLAKFFAHKGKLTKVIVLGLCGIWSFLSSWIVTVNPWWRYNWADGANNFLEMLSWRLSMNLTKIFPSFIRLSSVTPYLTLLGIVCIGVVIYACRFETRNSVKFLPQNLTIEYKVVVIITLFMSIFLGGGLIGKMLLTPVLEAEDTLDVRAYGGERVPPTFDPWNNQIYLREWKYYGWKLNPGDHLKTRPKLYHSLPSSKVGIGSERELQVYARAQLDSEKPDDFPVMLVLVNNKEVGKVTISSTGWKMYNFTLFVDEIMPRLEIRHQDTTNSQRALIIDKLRFH